MSIEEWWGRTFEGRRSDMELMGNRMEDIRQGSTDALLDLAATEDRRSARSLAAQMELRRRESWTARAALAVSIVALTISTLTALCRAFASS